MSEELNKNEDQKDEVQLIDNEKNEIVKVKKKRLVLRETLISLGLIVIISLIVFVMAIVNLNEDYFTIAKDYTFAKPIFIHCSYLGVIIETLLCLLCWIIRPSLIKPFFKKKVYIFLFLLFQILGVFAFILMNQILIVSAYKINMNQLLSLYITSLITLAYSYLIYKLFCENFIENKGLFYEVFRFCLVGLVAAIGDYLFTTLVRFSFVNLKDTWYATVVAVTVGFLVGVTINYFLSVFMVYKNTKSNFSKTKKGVVIFVLLSAVGLFIGYATELLLYNDKVYKLEPYIAVFLIRTVVVMVYNYLSRKFILFR